MELKKYQQKVISDLTDYLAILEEEGSLSGAFSRYWANRQVQVGVNGIPRYQNIIDQVPHVCYKVPTGGGKTFLACASVKPIFDSLHQRKVKALVWLVPSDAILSQTLAALKNPAHPYRQRLNLDFHGRVEVYEKAELLAGQNFSPATVTDQLSVMVLSYDSFRSSGKEGLKAYQANGNLAPFHTAFGAPELPIDKADDTALFQVINQLNPVVVVDESHHARSTLSLEMLKNFNPAFVLDLTATPRKEANIISYVDALQLKSENMVKLPVIAYNRDSQTDVLTDAIGLRNKLEELAIKRQEQEGGEYIRPIVLFQAQPKAKEDATSFEKLKSKLVEVGIPEEQIAIKTANTNELKNVDLLSEQCPVRYIITVNALKEGWDCPFAYVLASLANKTSGVDVEQILGRILRQPYTRHHREQLLNMSYVLTSSADFASTLQRIVEGLNEAGFTGKDYRVAETLPAAPEKEQPPTSPQAPLSSGTSSPEEAPEEEFLDFDPVQVATDTTVADAEDGEQLSGLGQLLESAATQGSEYEAAAEQAAQDIENLVPTDLADKVEMDGIKLEFADEVKRLRIPQFYIKTPGSQLFGDTDDDELVLLHKESLTKEFKLRGHDSRIDLGRASADMARIDVKRGDADVPKAYRMNAKDQQIMREYIASLPPEGKVRNAIATVHMRLEKKFDEIASSDLEAYITSVIEGLDGGQLETAVTAPLTAASRIEEKIRTYLDSYRLEQFMRGIEIGTITTQATYVLPDHIQPIDATSFIGGSLYEAEDSVNGLEYDLAMSLSDKSSVKWWHRIIERRGFCINGPINHYPDFMVETTSGHIVLVETKGEHLKNTEDTRIKLKLGTEWARMAGPLFHYLMVFDEGVEPPSGAHTLSSFDRILDALS